MVGRRLFFNSSLWFFAVVVFSISACAQITVGVILSTTGPASSLGIPEKNVMMLAPATVAGENVRYIVLDDASDPSIAVQNVKRLTSEYKVDVILGATTSPNSLAMLDTVAASQTPMVSLASASAITAPVDAKRKWVFKTPPNDDIHAMAMVPHMISKGIKTVSVIAVDDAYGEGLTTAFKKLAGEKGINTLTVEKFQRNETSVTAQVLHAMKVNPDAIFIACSGTPAVMPHRALIERGYKGKIYQASGAANMDFLRLGGKDVEGAYIASVPSAVAEQLPDGYPTKRAGLEFVHAYEPKFGPRSAFAANTWDALQIVEAAIPAALKVAKPGTPEFREALRTAIENTRGLKGASGVYTFSPTQHSGGNELGMVMTRVENGTWKLDRYAAFK